MNSQIHIRILYGILCMVRLGSWVNDLSTLQQQFAEGKPFEHVVIPNFFDKEDVETIYQSFPNVDESWHHYDNPLEQKYTLNHFEQYPIIQDVFATLQCNKTLDALKKITNIQNLECDPHLHGAGLHSYPSNGKLDMHLDYSIHPITKKERRVNLIIYMNKHWETEYGGHLQLWDETLSECTELIAPVFNTAVLFRTSDISYHGIPKPITCPPDQSRKSIAIYYVSPPREEATQRYKAEFFPLPEQEKTMDSRLAHLYEIRKQRLITRDDLKNWPTWRMDGQGYWL
jgi:hypothetical protein